MGIDTIFPPWAKEFLPGKIRYKIVYGGRGSAKSWTFARMLLVRASRVPIRVLCSRELQISIQDSVYQLLVDQIRALGQESKFYVQANRILSTCGSQILFKGLKGISNDASALKSLEGIDVLWIEEGQNVSAKSLEIIIPTIRKKHSEIWITMNPNLETDAVYQLIKNPPENSIIRKINFDQNPWFYETELPQEMEWSRKTDPDAYRHIWLGECRTNSDAQIFKNKFRIESFEVPPNAQLLHGADWGFSQDPTVLIQCYIQNRTLFVRKEMYKIGVEIDELPTFFRQIPESTRAVIHADNARPETISYMRRNQFNCVPAPKWNGSVEDGISFMKSFQEIVIHPDCPRTAEEFSLYSYKIDKISGAITTDIVDKNNHCIDSIRYALTGHIKARNNSTKMYLVQSI